MKPETKAIHSLNYTKASTGDVSMPISLSTTFYRGEDGGYPGIVE
jgi:cystathionine gamma-synthase